MTPYLYERRGERYFPGELVRGPWAPGTQNGAMVAGLLGEVLEAVPCRRAMIPMDFHIEILKPVPLGELTISTRVAREGQKLQVLQASLRADDSEVALATLVRLRAAPEIAPARSAPVSARTGPEGLAPIEHGSPYFAFMECRVARGGFGVLGPGAAWFRPRGQIIAGQPCSKLGVMMLCADVGSGLSAVVRRSEWAYPNVSLAIHSHRLPAGDWLMLESETLTEGSGVAQVSSAFSDLDGIFGRVQQALILEARS